MASSPKRTFYSVCGQLTRRVRDSERYLSTGTALRSPAEHFTSPRWVCLAQSRSENERPPYTFHGWFTRTSICMLRCLLAIGIRRHGPTSESFEMIIAIDNPGDMQIIFCWHWTGTFVSQLARTTVWITYNAAWQIRPKKHLDSAWKACVAKDLAFHASPRLGGLQETSRAAQSPWRWASGLLG